MRRLSRRELFRHSIAGLAAGGLGSLVLRADARPTPGTPDAHGYEALLTEEELPQIEPTGQWSPTTKDILGPYHLPGAPFRGKVTPPLEPGDLLVVHGRVWGYGTKKPLAHAVLDVWQADAKGRYDMDDPQNPPQRSAFKNRIRLVTDETGFYEYETIRPAAYKVGPGDRYRPSHIHYMIQAPGYVKLITQLYFKGDPYIPTDPWAKNSALVIEPKKITVEQGTYELGVFDIVLAPT